MPLLDDVFDRLSDSDSETSALFGVDEACRVWPGKASREPQMPYAVMTVIVTSPEVTHTRPCTLEETDVQFSCIAATYEDARALRAAIRADLDVDGGADTFIERDGFSDAVGVHVLFLDATFWNAPAIPA